MHLEDKAPNRVSIDDEVCDGPHVVDRRLELASEYKQENLCYDQQNRHDEKEEDLQEAHDPGPFAGAHRSRGEQLKAHSQKLAEMNRRDNH